MENQEVKETEVVTEPTAEEIEAAVKAEKEMVTRAHEYIYNVLNLGTGYTEEDYNRAFEEGKGPQNFTNFPFQDRLTNMITLIHGYGSFGRKFLEAVYDNDKASLLNMFESVTQEYLELDAAVKQSINSFEQQLAEKKVQEETISNAVNEN